MLLNRPVQTRFPYGSPTRVNLATHRNSQAHSSKGTQSPPRKKAPTAFKHTVSGTSSLSVTREYLGLADGPARFTRNFTGSVLLGNTPGRQHDFTYGTVTRYGQAFQTVPLPRCFLTSCHPGRGDQTVPQPPVRNACRLSHAQGLASSAFAHHY